MLYQLYELYRNTFIEPVSDIARSAARIYANPNNVFGQMPWSDRAAAYLELLYRLGKDYEKPEFAIRELDGVDVAIHERVEIDKPFCRLLRFKRYTDNAAQLNTMRDQPTVLLVAPLSGHYATLLRDTVRTMLRDHNVYITDWKNARNIAQSEGNFHLHDYVHYIQEFIRHVQKENGNAHVMSVCQPTVPVLAAVSLLASANEPLPLSMVMMGGPIDARKAPTEVNALAQNKSLSWFESNMIFRVPSHFVGAGRRVYPGFMQHAGFIAMNPSRHMLSHYEYFQDLVKGDMSNTEAHRQFYDEYNAVLDMDAHYYLDTIETVFQTYKLVRGSWDVPGVDGQSVQRVRPQDIKDCALLTVEGELDDISGSGQTQAAHALCTNIAADLHQHYEVQGAGHYGIFSGRRWREMVYPQVARFMLKHNAPKLKTSAPGASAQRAKSAAKAL